MSCPSVNGEVCTDCDCFHESFETPGTESELKNAYACICVYGCCWRCLSESMLLGNVSRRYFSFGPVCGSRGVMVPELFAFSWDVCFSLEAQCPDSSGRAGTGGEHGGLIVFFVCHIMLCIDDGVIVASLELTVATPLFASCGYAPSLLS